MGRHKGYKCSDEVRARMSAAAKRNWTDPEYRERTLGRLHKAVREKSLSPEEIERRTAMLRAIPPEVRSAASKKRWSDPSYRERISRSVMKAWQKDERLIRPDARMLALIHEYNDGPVGKKISAINLGITISTLERILRDYGIVWRKSRLAAKTVPEVGHPPNAAAMVAASVPDSSPQTGGSARNEPRVASFEAAA